MRLILVFLAVQAALLSLGSWARAQLDVETRKIQYGAPAAVANGLATSRPASAQGAASTRAAIPGQYRVERGKPGSGVFSEMTLTLNGDGTAEYRIVNEWRKQRTSKTATGTWAAEGTGVLVRLEKTSDGGALPDAMRSWRFRRTAAGDLVPIQDPNTTFKRVGDAAK